MGVALHDPPAFGTYFPGNGEILQMFAAWAVGRETLMPWMGILGLGVLGLAIRRLSLMVGARGPIAEGIALCIAGGPGARPAHTRDPDRQPARRLVHGRAAVRGAPPALAASRRSHGDAGRDRADGGLQEHGSGLAAAAARGGVRAPRGSARADPLSSSSAASGSWSPRCSAGSGCCATGSRPATRSSRPRRASVRGRSPVSSTARRCGARAEVQVWREGFAGHLTLPNLWDFYGPSLIALAIGLPLLLKPSRSRDEPRAARAAGRTDAWLLLILGSSPSCCSSSHRSRAPTCRRRTGQPPPLNIDNMRLLASVRGGADPGRGTRALAPADAGVRGLGTRAPVPGRHRQRSSATCCRVSCSRR